MAQGKPIIQNRSRWNGNGFDITSTILYPDGSTEVLQFQCGPEIEPNEYASEFVGEHMTKNAAGSEGQASTGTGPEGETGKDGEGETGDADGGDESDNDGETDSDEAGSDDGDKESENDSDDADSDDATESEDDVDSENDSDDDSNVNPPPEPTEQDDVFWMMIGLHWESAHGKVLHQLGHKVQ